MYAVSIVMALDMSNAIAPVHLDVGQISDPAIIVADSDTLRGVVVSSREMEAGRL